MGFLQTQFKTHQHLKVSCSTTDAAKAMLVAVTASDILHRHTIGQPSPRLSTETIKPQKKKNKENVIKPYCIQIFTE